MLVIAGPVLALAPDPLAQQLSERALDASELAFERRTGQISAADYAARFQQDRAQIAVLNRQIDGLPSGRRAFVRQQAVALTQDGLVRLRAGWTQYLAAHDPNRHHFEGGWLLLLLAAAAGAAWFIWARRRKSGARAFEAHPVPAQRSAPAPAAAGSRAARLTAPGAPGTPANPGTAGPAEAARSAAAAGPASPEDASTASRHAAGAAAAGGGLTREQLLAQMQSKYQAGLTAATEQLGSTQQELAQLAAIPDALRSELLRIGASVHATTRQLVRAQMTSSAKAVRSAVLLLPLWRPFRRPGLIRRIIWAAILWSVASEGLRLLASRSYGSVLMAYIALVAVLFFFERRSQSRSTAAVDRSAAALKTPRLLYAYPQQVPVGQPGSLTYQVLRISSGAGQPMDETTLDNQSDDSGLGACFVWFDETAVYRLDCGGRISQSAVYAGNPLMGSFGSCVTEALARHAAGFDPALEQMRRYGDLKWLERVQSSAIPRFEGLLSNAERVRSLWSEVAVTDKVIEFLIRRIDLFNTRDRATPNGILLYGYPGNGKEFLAHRIAESVFAQFVKPTADQLASARSIKELWAAHSASAPVVLYIDYADQVFARTGDQEGAGREATLAWLEEWSRREPWQSGVWVVMSAQSDQNLHPRVLAQFGSSKIEIAPPDAAGREQVLGLACAENQLQRGAPRWLIESSGGSSVRELRDVVREVRLQSLADVPSDEQWRAALRAVRGSEAAFRDESKTWDRLVLPADTKGALQRAARILREADRYRDKKVSVPNILLFGPPGTGKTDIARTFANEGGVKFIAATTADLKAQYVGQSAHLVRDLFARARAGAPCVLFIDEIETVAAKRGAGNSDAFTQEIVTEMLAQMDGARINDRPVIVLAATNLPEQIDPAILNRFTNRIEVPLPDEAARKELLVRLIRERPVDPALDIEEVAALLARSLARKSGRDLVMLVNRAMERAVAASESPEEVRLTREILTSEARPKGREVSDADLEKIWGQIVLPQEIKSDILDKIRMFNRGDKAAPRGLLLYGPPGTGKTEIARRIADSASCFFMALKAPDLKAGYVGQSGERVQKVWEQARGRGRCVIFVDECEGVFARRGGSNADAASEELVQAFLAEWDGVGTEDQRVWVVGATNRRDLLDEAIVSRFGAAIQIDLPGPAERLQILRLEMAKLERPAEVPEFLGQATTGLSGRNLSMLAREVCTQAARQGGVISDALWREVLRRHTKSGSEAVDEGAHWDSLILPQETLEKLRTLCELLRHAEDFKAQGFEIPRGALLYGPPGTGKTQIARTLANESGLPFLAATTAELKAGFIGQSGQKVRELFERARGRAPCILFLDEIETVAPARGGSGADSFTGEIVTQLLQELDGVRASPRHVFVLAATNLPDAIDAAVLSRFEEKIEIGKPDGVQRQQLFRLFLSKQRVDFDRDAVSAELAELTADIGGRDIRALVQRASQQAIRRALAAGTPQAVMLTRADLVASVPRARP